ncbi:sensor domain-containing diguanylate cyclase [Halanaerobium salsuginis]|jgi:diguanylate cyclase (GGDEF)-like protein|uniref:Diguanylate cyclase (GGDEF) domain-containing protein n=1 Tax=Halanaerobium salsuginis TaxID=29563 RepID=A0A1I4HS57_9FIRM|nr:diguanylate cyclase [Halanaerobium salsuginis]SFL44864.1 diguanylate cyclase (GGDEF) domain-containing protein [Halanaerobium salsuginis]
MQRTDIYKNKYYLLILCVIILLFFLFLFYNYQIKLNEQEYFLDNNLTRIRNEVNLILNTYNTSANAIFNNIINSKEIKRTIKFGWEFEDRRDNYRFYLKNNLESLYDNLNSYHIHQLQFNFKNGVSFLRMDRPDKYGDNLFELRETIRYVNQSKQKYFGFDQSRIFSDYSYIYPLFYKGEHIGSVEIGISFKAIAELLAKNFGGTNILIVKKDLVNRVVFDDEKEKYQQLAFVDDFLYDADIYKKSLEFPIGILQSEIRFMNNQNRNVIKRNLDRKIDFAINSKISGKYYTGYFIRIEGINDNINAYLISYLPNDSLRLINNNFNNTLLVSTFLLILTIILISLIFYSNSSLRYMAKNDQLTNVSNRHHLNEVLTKEYERKQRNNIPFSFIIFDIDHFKRINDNYGHDTGDIVLKKLSQLIEANIRKSDYFGRWGGEEFVIIATETSLNDAVAFAEKLNKIIEEYSFIESEAITVSLGVAEIKETEKIDDLIKRADKALYQAKERGRNRVEAIK